MNAIFKACQDRRLDAPNVARLLVEQDRNVGVQPGQRGGPGCPANQQGASIGSGAVKPGVQAGNVAAGAIDRDRLRLVMVRGYQENFRLPGYAHGKGVAGASKQAFGFEAFLVFEQEGSDFLFHVCPRFKPASLRLRTG